MARKISQGRLSRESFLNISSEVEGGVKGRLRGEQAGCIMIGGQWARQLSEPLLHEDSPCSLCIYQAVLTSVGHHRAKLCYATHQAKQRGMCWAFTQHIPLFNIINIRLR